MISYAPFWRTLQQKGGSAYRLIHTYYISGATLSRLRHDKPLSTVTINDLRRILQCQIQDIPQYVESDNDEHL